MNEIIKLLLTEGLVFPLQIIILIIDAYLVLNTKSNGYVLLSLVLIFSIFVLQTVRRRFLLLYPKQQWAGYESAEIDTYYLRGIVILSAFSSLMGLFSSYTNSMPKWAIILESYIPIPLISLLTIVIIPCFFCLFSNLINDRIAKKLKSHGPYISVVTCHCCKYPYAIQKREVIHKNLGKITFKCEHCNNDIVREVTLPIGE